MTAPQKPPLTPAEHITRAKQELAAGDHTAAQTHALIAIAEQGQPVEHEHERQRPILLTNDQLNRAAESLTQQTGIASLEICGNIVARMIRDINGGETVPAHDCTYADPRMCAWPGHRR